MGEEENYFDNIYRGQQKPAPLEEPRLQEAPKSVQQETVKVTTAPAGATAAPGSKGLSPWLIPLVGGLLLALGLGAFFLSRHSSKSAPVTTVSPTPVATNTPTNPSAAPTTEVMPLLQAYPQAPKVRAGMVKASPTAAGTVTTTSGRTLTVRGAKVASASNPCVVQEVTDFCMVGIIPGKTPQSVYFLKDAAHSRLFANQNGFKAVKVTGSPAAGILRLNTGNRGQMPVLVVVNKDSSGWMFVSSSPAQAPLDIAKQVTVS